MTSPLRVGIIGCGNVALNFHVPAYDVVPDRYIVVGMADPTPERLELGRAAARLTDSQVHLEAAELLAREDIDVVDVCTPQHLHRDLVVAAARAGKHILCEKPIAAAPADARAMITAARESNVVLAVVHNYLFFPEIVAARQLIAAGRIGDIRTVTVDMLGVVDSPGAAGYRPQWRHDPASAGGGVLMDMLHGVYLAESLLGAPVTSVSAFVDSVADGDRVEGIALCRLEADRRAAMVNVGWGLGSGGVAVSGTKGRIVLQYRDFGTMPWAPFETLSLTDGSTTELIDLPSGQELAPLISQALRDTVVDLADAVAGSHEPAANGEAALRTLEATVAAYASAALGRNIEVPLSPESPLHSHGVVGLQTIDVPAQSPVRARGLYGLRPHASENVTR